MSNLTKWSPQIELRDRATHSGPALATNGPMCMAWRGLDQDLDQNNIGVSTLLP
jgi:hypothetical protein